MREIERVDLGLRLKKAEAHIQDLEHRIAGLAHLDSNTGLPNQARFLDRLDQAILQSTRQAQKVAVIVLDLDRFKRVNDLLGHPGGDDILRQVARRLEGSLRLGDTLAAMGGDRFMVLLPTLKEDLGAMKVGLKLLESLAAPFQAGGEELQLTASMGICLFPPGRHGEHHPAVPCRVRHVPGQGARRQSHGVLHHHAESGLHGAPGDGAVPQGGHAER